MRPTRVIIAGGRDFGETDPKAPRYSKYHMDWSLCELACERVLAVDDEIVGGRAKGADTMGEAYAAKYWHPFTPFPADWKTHGRSAGFIRNKQMADYADALIAFWDGKSRGTKHMIDTALSSGLSPIVIYRYV